MFDIPFTNFSLSVSKQNIPVIKYYVINMLLIFYSPSLQKKGRKNILKNAQKASSLNAKLDLFNMSVFSIAYPTATVTLLSS